MKKWLFLFGCSLMLCGCTKSNIVSKGGELVPDFETRADIELDWDQAFTDLKAEYIDDEESVCSFSFFMDEEEDGIRTLYINTLVDAGMRPAEAAVLGTRILKSLNDYIADQDFSLAVSSSNSYGGFFDDYNVGLRIIPEDQHEDQSMALVDDLILAGEVYRPVKSNQ